MLPWQGCCGIGSNLAEMVKEVPTIDRLVGWCLLSRSVASKSRPLSLVTQPWASGPLLVIYVNKDVIFNLKKLGEQTSMSNRKVRIAK